MILNLSVKRLSEIIVDYYRAKVQLLAKGILSVTEISTEHRYLSLIHSLNKPAGFINEPAEVFCSYIPACKTKEIIQTNHNKII